MLFALVLDHLIRIGGNAQHKVSIPVVLRAEVAHLLALKTEVFLMLDGQGINPSLEL